MVIHSISSYVSKDFSPLPLSIVKYTEIYKDIKENGYSEYYIYSGKVNNIYSNPDWYVTPFIYSTEKDTHVVIWLCFQIIEYLLLRKHLNLNVLEIIHHVIDEINNTLKEAYGENNKFSYVLNMRYKMEIKTFPRRKGAMVMLDVIFLDKKDKPYSVMRTLFFYSQGNYASEYYPTQ
ncbi:hypothetical protein C5468_17525 [Photorhabdus luminescens subsp. mexicana]|uniref:Uncharacterized protein n=2 Tax=Photorhabdus luminescens TaxID=29488 RepID=A0A4R4J458_PHOLU|nr:hypothetical protein C5468_17525 [Photorhabdus luminescens subsp. mexicana]